MGLLGARRTLAAVGLVAGMGCAVAAPVKPGAGATAPVVMLSDFHFDPYHDPAKFERLRVTAISGWTKILAEPDSASQPVEFKKLLAACATRTPDSQWTLLESSLEAAKASEPHPLFVTVSGDLLTHVFDCRFKTLARGAGEAEQSAFAAKTVAYVAAELKRTFPETPVYLALGNNDAGCGDYKEAEDSSFLHEVAKSVADDAGSERTRKEVLRVFPVGGDYSVELPKPIVRGRLIVLQNIFLSKGYKGCDGKPDAAPGVAQLEWLREELAAAHAKHEQVWVMAHIPPGLDMYSTVRNARDVCAGQAPVMFLRDETLVEVMTEFAADIRLAIFAHTHNDEMRLFQGAKGDERIAVKLVPSVSPVNGNRPGFTVADVSLGTAALKDYRVVAADNKTGVAAKWRELYRYSAAYGSTGFTPEEVARLLGKMKADRDGTSAVSLAYQQNFFPGGGLGSMAVKLVWPGYVCSMLNNTADGYRGCLCAAKP